MSKQFITQSGVYQKINVGGGTSNSFATKKWIVDNFKSVDTSKLTNYSDNKFVIDDDVVRKSGTYTFEYGGKNGLGNGFDSYNYLRYQNNWYPIQHDTSAVISVELNIDPKNKVFYLYRNQDELPKEYFDTSSTTGGWAHSNYFIADVIIYSSTYDPYYTPPVSTKVSVTIYLTNNTEQFTICTSVNGLSDKLVVSPGQYGEYNFSIEKNSNSYFEIYSQTEEPYFDYNVSVQEISSYTSPDSVRRRYSFDGTTPKNFNVTVTNL